MYLARAHLNRAPTSSCGRVSFRKPGRHHHLLVWTSTLKLTICLRETLDAKDKLKCFRKDYHTIEKTCEVTPNSLDITPCRTRLGRFYIFATRWNTGDALRTKSEGLTATRIPCRSAHKAPALYSRIAASTASRRPRVPEPGHVRFSDV